MKASAPLLPWQVTFEQREARSVRAVSIASEWLSFIVAISAGQTDGLHSAGAKGAINLCSVPSGRPSQALSARIPGW